MITRHRALEILINIRRTRYDDKVAEHDEIEELVTYYLDNSKDPDKAWPQWAEGEKKADETGN